MTYETSEKRRTTKRAAWRKYLERETPEQKAERLRIHRLYQREWKKRNPLTEEQRQKGNAYSREYQRKIRETETPEEREVRLTKRRATYKRRRERRRGVGI